MDYIDRKRRGLERDAAYWTRQYHRTLSRLYVERERLAATPMTDPHAIRDLAGRVREHADLAVRLRRRRAEANLRLLAFDPDAQRRANKDVDGACRYLNLDGTRCGACARATWTDGGWTPPSRTISSDAACRCARRTAPSDMRTCP